MRKETMVNTDIYLHNGDVMELKDSTGNKQAIGALLSVEAESMTTVNEEGKRTYVPFHAVEKAQLMHATVYSPLEIDDPACNAEE